MSDRPAGYYQYVLALDCETSGLTRSSRTPQLTDDGGHYQAVSWGLIVADAHTYEEVDSLYFEVQWNGMSEWMEEAERVHGLSKEYLAENGITEEEAVLAIASFIMPYWGPTGSIVTLGHNSPTFDNLFLSDLFERYEIPLKLGNRHIDTGTIGKVCYNAFTSDELFRLMGYETRDAHNSLDDARMSLGTVRTTAQLFQSMIGGD